MPVKSNTTSPNLRLRPPTREALPSVTADRLKALMNSTAIEVVPIASLRPNPKNTRKHPAKQIELLAKNFEAFGIHTPVVTDETGMILCGHARVEAAKLLGLDQFPTIPLHGLSLHQKSALAIADNRIAELGEANREILAQELTVLFDTEIDLDFDPSIMGFDTVEVDQHLADSSAKVASDPADVVAAPMMDEPAVSRTGDTWRCGRNKLICGDALQSATYSALMGDELAQIITTDPPWNVPNKGHVTKRPGVREFAQAHGEMSSKEFTEFLSTTCVMISRYAIDGAVIYVCMDWRHLPELTAAAAPTFGAPRNVIVWVKTNAGLGSFYRSQHELIMPFVKGKTPPINNFGLGAKGRYRSNVWKYPGCNSFGRERDSNLAMHPTVKRSR